MKKTTINILTILLIVIVVEIVKFSIPHFIPFKELSNEDEISIFHLLAIIIGGGWALFIYTKNSKRERNNFLKIYVSTTLIGDFLSINTRVINKTDQDKKIYAAFLIITIQPKDIISEVNKHLSQSFKNTNSLSNLKDHNTLIKEDFAFIQLPYYYNENIKVDNEDLSYSLGTILKKYPNSRQEVYEVRFFVYRNPKDRNPYHRIVQTTFSAEQSVRELFKNIEIKSLQNAKTKKI